MQSGIYTITSPSGKQYVGSAVRFDMRWYAHKSELRKGRHHSQALQRAANKYGIDNLIFDRLLVCKPVDLIFYEQRAIDILKPDYNTSPRAGSQLGFKHSDKTRLQMSANSSHHKPTEYQIYRIKEVCTGRSPSAETRALQSAKAIGRNGKKGPKHSVESRARISAGRKGKKPANCFELTATPEILKALVDDYSSGMGLKTLKKKYHSSGRVLRQLIAASGVEPHPVGVRAREAILIKEKLLPVADQIVAEYPTSSAMALAKKYNLPIRQVKKLLAGRWISLRSRGTPKGRPSNKALARKVGAEGIRSIVADYARGLGLRRIAAKWGSTSTYAIRGILIAAGVPIRAMGAHAPKEAAGMFA